MRSEDPREMAGVIESEGLGDVGDRLIRTDQQSFRPPQFCLQREGDGMGTSGSLIFSSAVSIAHFGPDEKGKLGKKFDSSAFWFDL